MPEGAEDGILKGMYRLTEWAGTGGTVRLIGSGAILNEVIAAADILAEQFGIASEVFSATSFSELERDAREVERRNRLSGAATPEQSHVEALLAGDAPVIAATDYVRAVPQLIAPHVRARFVALGTDGFGRSDKRVALRRFFEVDRQHIALAALEALLREGKVEHGVLVEALRRFGVDGAAPAPWTI